MLDDKLLKMDQLLKILNIESCLRIYSYLMVFGKTTPAELREVTGLSKATMFRNLALLLEAGILKKQEVKSVSDKRYSLHYYIGQNLIESTKKIYSPKLREHAESIGKSDLINTWLSNLETFPYLLNQYTSQAIMMMAQMPQEGSEKSCAVVSKLVIFRLGDIAKIAKFNERLIKLVEDFDLAQTESKRDWKKPLSHPVALSINIVALNPDDIPKASGAAMEIMKC